jgi:hypothetical protein
VPLPGAIAGEGTVHICCLNGRLVVTITIGVHHKKRDRLGKVVVVAKQGQIFLRIIRQRLKVLRTTHRKVYSNESNMTK